jgi:hypothetical protein
MSFLQLPAEKKTAFLVGISFHFRPFLFRYSFTTKEYLLFASEEGQEILLFYSKLSL